MRSKIKTWKIKYTIFSTVFVPLTVFFFLNGHIYPLIWTHLKIFDYYTFDLLCHKET